MGLQNSDAFLVNRSGTDYQESWQNILNDVDVDLGVTTTTDDLSAIRTDSGVGGSVLGATISNAGSGYTDGTFSNVSVVSINGRGNSLFLDEIVLSGGVLTGFTLKVNEANTGIGYVEGEVVQHTGAPGTPFELTITKVGNGGFYGNTNYGGAPLSDIYVPRDFTTLNFLP